MRNSIYIDIVPKGQIIHSNKKVSNMVSQPCVRVRVGANRSNLRERKTTNFDFRI
jgi:hypothetical protein